MTGLWHKLKSLAKSKPIPVIDERLWQRATHGYGFMRGLSVEENRRLRLIASDFLSRKTIVGAAGVEITERMRVEIAAQASILVLELGVDYFDGWRDIIVYPSQFMPEREVIDEVGVVHLTRDTLAGEAWLHGPVVLSYEDVARTGTADAIDGFNVVIHEFAHKLDMINGEANGLPPLGRGMSMRDWKDAFMPAYLHFCEAVDKAEAQSAYDGGAALDELLIDPYASENPAEFFAVLSEAFFEIPENIMAAYPKVYEQLRLFYKQDPLRRMPQDQHEIAAISHRAS
jgi:MtfA peptidase